MYVSDGAEGIEEGTFLGKTVSIIEGMEEGMLVGERVYDTGVIDGALISGRVEGMENGKGVCVSMRLEATGEMYVGECVIRKFVGSILGLPDGERIGETLVGKGVRSCEFSAVGVTVGVRVGDPVGDSGPRVGVSVETAGVGGSVGTVLGDLVGDAVGTFVGSVSFPGASTTAKVTGDETQYKRPRTSLPPLSACQSGLVRTLTI